MSSAHGIWLYTRLVDIDLYAHFLMCKKKPTNNNKNHTNCTEFNGCMYYSKEALYKLSCTLMNWLHKWIEELNFNKTCTYYL